MSEFIRTRRDPSDGVAPTITFLVREKQREKFEARNSDLTWTDVETQLNFKVQDIVISRLASKSGEQDACFEFLIPMPIEDVEEPRSSALRFVATLNNAQNAFFVIAASINTHAISPRPETLQSRWEIKFIRRDTHGRASNEFWELWEDMQKLQISKTKKEVSEELSNWTKYLAVIEKISNDKAILLKVKSPNPSSNRRRGDTIEYAVDANLYAEKLEENLREILQEYPVSNINIKDGEGNISFTGNVELDGETIESLDLALNRNFFQWEFAPNNPKRQLAFQVEPRYGVAKYRTERLEELDGMLRSKAISFSRNGQSYSLTHWEEWLVFKAILENDLSLWQKPKAPRISLELLFSLDNATTRETLILQLQQQLKRQGALAITRNGKDLLNFKLSPSKTPNIFIQKANFEYESVKLKFTTSLKDAESKVEGKTPKLINKGGAVIKGDDVEFRSNNGKGIKDRYQSFVMENPAFSFPSFEQLNLEYEIGFAHLLFPAKWKLQQEKHFNGISGIQKKGNTITIQPQTLDEYESQLNQISNERLGLSVELSSIQYDIRFHHEDPQKCKIQLAECKTKLAKAYGEKIQFAPNVKSNGISGSLTFQNVNDWSSTRKALETNCGQNFTLHYQGIEGRTILELRTDEKQLNNYFIEKRKVLGRCTIKFLSHEQYKEYENERKGKDGKYDGGTEIGKLQFLSREKIKIAINEDLDTKVHHSTGYLIPTFYGDIAQINRLKGAMNLLVRSRENLPQNINLSNFIFDAAAARKIDLEFDIHSDHDWRLRHELNEKNLNEDQKEAVWKALNAQDLALIQGPPGTGKTTVIAEIIWQMLQENPDQKILITSQSHLAVDNALQRLYKKNLIRPLRVAARAGNAIEPEGRIYFREVIEAWADGGLGSKEEKENDQNAITVWMDRIQKAILLEDKFAATQTKWKQKLEKANPDTKKFLKRIYLENVNVVAATCLECGRGDFKGLYKENGFDCVIVDEASKSTPPELLVPLVLGRKIVIIGDHKQLPPMIEEKGIVEVLEEMGELDLAEDIESFKTSQFEKLFQDANDNIKVTLRTQYRMHNSIMQVINAFYKEEGGLECGIKTDMDLPDFNIRGSRWHGISSDPLFHPDHHVLWVDVQTPETNHSPSYSNDGEVEAIHSILATLTQNKEFESYLDACAKHEEKGIGIISFYGKQVEKLKNLVREFETEKLPIRLRTVDKFQGMERDIMIVSTVRSNQQIQHKSGSANNELKHRKPNVRENKAIGFAKDFRRVNVALSRARRLLIIVGNEKHFSDNHKMYAEISDTIHRNGRHIDARQLKTNINNRPK